MFGEERNARRGGIGEGEEYELRAADASTYNVDEPREARIIAWRVECFKQAGADILNAVALAVRRDIDRVQVEALLKAGATGAEVVGILT